jgi:hypothetical protein
MLAMERFSNLPAESIDETACQGQAVRHWLHETADEVVRL